MVFDSRNAAFMFPGQGTQIVGMGKELQATFTVAREIFSEADAILGTSFSDVMWNGPESELNDTINTQPALYIHSLAAYRTFQAIFPGNSPSFLAGHSLGQLSAIAAAGAITFDDGLRLVRKRGELMKQAGIMNPGGMAAILGVDIPTLDKVCCDASVDGEIVQVANDNCPGQVVISGHKAAVERAIAGAKAMGAKRALPLPISIAAHSPLMSTIQAEWNEAVMSASFSDVSIPVVGNVSAEAITRAADLRADVIAQMQSRVRWTESIKLMSAQGVKTYFEFGSGTVLCGLVKRIVDGGQFFPMGTSPDFEAIR